MDINENQELKEQINQYYLEFEQQQFILNFEDKAERVTIQGFDKDNNKVFEKEFTPKFINSHLNITWQDKGTKSEEPLYEYKLVRIE